MEKTTIIHSDKTPNRLSEILTEALNISSVNKLKEVCSEALLYAILSDEETAAKLLKMGFNIFMFKRLLAEKLKKKAADNPPTEPPYSVAVDGLLILNAMSKRGHNKPLQLLKIIVENNNTAAARLLKSEHLTLNNFNELVYKPIIN